MNNLKNNELYRGIKNNDAFFLEANQPIPPSLRDIIVFIGCGSAACLLGALFGSVANEIIAVLGLFGALYASTFSESKLRTPIDAFVMTGLMVVGYVAVKLTLGMMCSIAGVCTSHIVLGF